MKKHHLFFLFFLCYLLVPSGTHGQHASSGSSVFSNQAGWFNAFGIIPANEPGKNFVTHDGLNIPFSFSTATNDNQLVPGQMNSLSRTGNGGNIQSLNATPFFITPDTVCVNTPVNIQNQSTNASSYYWNFCVSDITNIFPNAVNLGNPGGLLSQPVFSDFVEANGNYYMFVVNHTPGALIRLDFGNSLLNAPTARNMGNFGGILQNSTEGIQIVKEGNQWYGLIVGGTPASATVPRIIKLAFGNDITTLTPTVTNWGNPGNNLSFPVDIHVFKESGNWYAFVVNSDNNTFTRIDFGPDFSSTPTTLNFSIPDLNFPTGIFVMNDNNNWHAFITNHTGRTLIRVDFGSSLLNNTPTSVNLGNPDNALTAPRDLYILRSCDGIAGFVVNTNRSTLVRLNFENGLDAAPVATDLGNNGGLNFPHSISKLFRVGNDLYSFITNVDNNTITRLQFAGCNNASILSTTNPYPSSVIYREPGTYNISLTVDEGMPTQASYCKQIVVVAPPAKSPVQQFPICPGETITLEKNLPGNISYTWNTGATTNTIDVNATGIYWVDMSYFGCTTRDSFNVVDRTGDFSYVQDICNPLQVSFVNQTPQTTSIAWNFGNGSTNNTDNVTTIVYNSSGTYIVTMNVSTANGCTLSVQKELHISVPTDSLIITRDTTLCENSVFQLNSVPALSYCWFPAEGLSSPYVANPYVMNPVAPVTYYLHASKQGENLIINGDFSQGNTGFSSSYTYNPVSGWDLGTYTVSNNIGAWHQYFASCNDHTPDNNGNMYMANGIESPNTTIWEQKVNVVPNSNYNFSGWLQSLQPVNPASLQLYINNEPVGNPFTGTAAICQWEQFSASWNAGNNSTATLRIVNLNIKAAGNDFALDDLSFAGEIFYRDSITLQIEKTVVTASVTDATICENDKTELNATGALTYSWSPAADLSNAKIANLIASPKTSTTYTVTGTTAFGCTASDQVTVQVNPAPVITGITPDTVICKNTAIPLEVNSNGSGFTWTNAASLNDPAIYNPIATPVQNSTKYIVTVTDAIHCSTKDSVTVTVRPDPVFRVSPNTTICDKDTISLSATGGERFNWQPALSLSSASITNPKAFPGSTTTYAVTITDTVCNNVANLQTTITVNPTPVVTAIKDNDLDCSFGSAQLTAQGAVRYNWAPVTGLNRANIANPVASPITPTQYVVTGYNRYGCADTDTLQLNILTTNKGDNLMPNAFTPNNDGHNDCYGIKFWGVMERVEFSIFNRWGQRVFYSNQADGCWDGTVKGIPQAAGTYVYMINAVTNCGTISRKGTFVLIR